jgi:hypothetical protein
MINEFDVRGRTLSRQVLESRLPEVNVAGSIPEDDHVLIIIIKWRETREPKVSL